MHNAEEIADLVYVAGDEDILTFVDRHGLNGLEMALRYAREYAEGSMNHRIMARELELDPLESGIILESLRPIVEKEPDYSDERWGDVTEREEGGIEDRFKEHDDDARWRSSEEPADNFGISLEEFRINDADVEG